MYLLLLLSCLEIVEESVIADHVGYDCCDDEMALIVGVH